MVSNRVKTGGASRRRRRRGDAELEAAHVPEGVNLPPAPPSVPEEPRRPKLDQAWKVRMAQVAIIGAVVVGAITGPLALVASTRPAGGGDQAQRAAASSVGPEGFAELYLRSYLNQADERRPEFVAAFYPDAKDAIDGMAAGQFYVAQTATLWAREVGDGYWSILVAADLLEMTEQGAQNAGTSYYLVSVFERDRRYVATSLPAQVPTPRSLPAPKLTVGKLISIAPGDRVAEAVQRFFEALLMGQGELSRYVGPESGIRAITPPPFTTVKLKRMSKPGAGAGPVVVLAEVAGENAAGHTRVLHYNLELEQKESRWEVSGLLLSPALAQGQG